MEAAVALRHLELLDAWDVLAKVDPRLSTRALGFGIGTAMLALFWSRAFAMLIVLLGLAVLSLVTASVAAIFVGTEERQIERDLMRELASLRAEVRLLADALRREPAPRTDAD